MSYPNNQYGQQPQQPAYGGYPQQPQPQYGQPIPGDGAVQPGYSASPQPGYPGQPAYAAPQSGYPAQAQPGYGAPAYGAPNGFTPSGTPQLPFASWGTRVVAYLADGLIFGMPALLLYGLAVTVGTESVKCPSLNSSNGSYRCTGGGFSEVGIVLMLLAAVIGFVGIVFIAYREGTTGQTPGKKMLGIRLISESTGQPIGFGAAFGRKLCHALDGLPCYVGFLWPLWDAKGQTFADKMVRTIVVKS